MQYELAAKTPGRGRRESGTNLEFVMQTRVFANAFESRLKCIAAQGMYSNYAR